MQGNDVRFSRRKPHLAEQRHQLLAKALKCVPRFPELPSCSDWIVRQHGRRGGRDTMSCGHDHGNDGFDEQHRLSRTVPVGIDDR